MAVHLWLPHWLLSSIVRLKQGKMKGGGEKMEGGEATPTLSLVAVDIGPGLQDSQNPCGEWPEL